MASKCCMPPWGVGVLQSVTFPVKVACTVTTVQVDEGKRGRAAHGIGRGRACGVAATQPQAVGCCSALNVILPLFPAFGIRAHNRRGRIEAAQGQKSTVAPTHPSMSRFAASSSGLLMRFENKHQGYPA